MCVQEPCVYLLHAASTVIRNITSALYVLITFPLYCLLCPALSSRLLLAGLDLAGQSLEPVLDILPGALCPDHHLKIISSTYKRNPPRMFMIPAKYLQVICLYNLSPFLLKRCRYFLLLIPFRSVFLFFPSNAVPPCKVIFSYLAEGFYFGGRGESVFQ